MVIKNSHLIGTKPGSSSPAIAGTRIRVSLIAEICQEIGEGPHAIAEILTSYPDLTVDQIQAAIDFWHDYPEEIQAEIDADEDAVRELRADPPPWFRSLRKD